jgi:hypothetical protein
MSYWYSSSSAYVGDTVISGTVYHRLYTSYLGGYFLAAVREDTTLQKVFFRLLSGSDVASISCTITIWD